MAQYDGLLKQISDYEKYVLEKKNDLRELRQAILKSRNELKITEEIISQKQNELKQKTSKLIDKELTSKLLSSKENIFIQQKSELEKALDEINNQLIVVHEDLSEEREKFCETIKDLNAKCGLESTYCKIKEQEFQDELTTLKLQKQNLQSELEEINEKVDVINQIKEKRQQLSEHLEYINQTIREMASSWCSEIQKTNDLEKEYQSVQETTSNTEFTSIREELSQERRKSQKLENEFNDLQSKFHILHQKIWKQKQHKY
ncbi:hypothetical protein ACF0H5_000973 [Mactra antiquata]